MARRAGFWRRLTGWLGNLRHRFFGWITAPRAAALLLGVLGVLIGYGGYLYQYCACEGWPNLVAGWEQLFLDFYANVAASLVTITIAVLTIDWLNEQRAEQELKQQLIREMGHPTDNGVALRAVRELEAHGWLFDGSLHEADLYKADLHEADLSEADLQGANLYRVDLHEAFLNHVNLRGTYLHQANLQGANLYRANLQGANLADAKLQGADLTDANLQGTRELTDRQLVTVLFLLSFCTNGIEP